MDIGPIKLFLQQRSIKKQNMSQTFDRYIPRIIYRLLNDAVSTIAVLNQIKDPRKIETGFYVSSLGQNCFLPTL
jgi:hypothetical protein